MANPSKVKGTKAETRVVRYLEDRGFVARRQALAGSNDPGDIEAYAPKLNDKIIIEIKTGKQTQSISRGQLEKWCRQAEVEAVNSESDYPVLIIVRYHRALKDADVYIPNGKSRTHWYLDDWVNQFGELMIG